ncbi:MAG: ATP-dependent metallopeptidase FtsH/Yme1/Tma family protein, partial [Candidatus Cloacimonetes bacterium]|nr:ATP-dependent metallopeptidase FtsH/Yme1/Tma family protein [Candidatus Cloacimonadota bacterium]
MQNNQNRKNQDNDKKPRFPRMKKSQTITFWIVLLLFIIVMFQMSRMNSRKVTQITYSEFLEMFKRGEVLKAGFSEKDVTITAIDNTKYTTYLPFRDPELVKELTDAGVIVYSHKPSKLLTILLS